MGVTGFWEYMVKYSWKLDPSELTGKTLTIDGHSWLFESSPLRGQLQTRNSFLLTFYKRCLTLRQYSIEPIVVFDKIPLAFDSQSITEPGVKMLTKKRTKRGGNNGWNANVLTDLNKRVFLVKELLTAMGVRYVEGGADGDAQCAQLEEIGLSNGCITSDLDYFLFGGKDIYKIDFARGGDSISSVHHLSMTKLENLMLNRNRMVALAIMLGCDYVEGGIERVGMISALEILSEFALHEDDHPISILDRFAGYLRGELPVREEDTDRKRKIRTSNIVLPDGFPNTDAYIEASCLYLHPRVQVIDPKDIEEPTPLDSKAVSTLLQRECDWAPKKISFPVKPKRSTVSRLKQSSMPNYFSSTRRRRSLPVIETCSQEDRNKCSQREWAALEKLREKGRLYANVEKKMTKKCDSPSTSSSNSDAPPQKRARKIIIEASSSTTCTQQQRLNEEIISLSDSSSVIFLD